MPLITSIGVYIIIWWVVLFMTLPLWVKPHQGEFGTAGSAPENPHLLKKMLLTTVIAAFIWLAVYICLETGLIEDLVFNHL